MNSFITVIQAVLPVFGVLLAGVLMRRVNWLTHEADTSLMRVTINVLAPCLAFDAIIGNQALEQASNLLCAPLVGFGTVTLGIAVGLIGYRLAGIRDPNAQRTFAFVVGLYNYGYVPLPLAQMLFNKETVGVLFVHNIGVEIALWTFGLAMMGERKKAGGWRNMINVPLVAIVCALVLNLLGARHWMPVFVMSTAKMLGQCAIPLGLVLVGATIADHAHEFHPARGGRVMGVSCLLRLGLLPILFLLLAYFLPCSTELKAVIVLQAAMPSAVFPIVMTKHYGGDTPTALRIVMATSIVSLLTIPLWIRFGLKFVGM